MTADYKIFGRYFIIIQMVEIKLLAALCSYICEVLIVSLLFQMRSWQNWQKTDMMQ